MFFKSFFNHDKMIFESEAILIPKQFNRSARILNDIFPFLLNRITGSGVDRKHMAREDEIELFYKLKTNKSEGKSLCYLDSEKEILYN